MESEGFSRSKDIQLITNCMDFGYGKCIYGTNQPGKVQDLIKLPIPSSIETTITVTSWCTMLGQELIALPGVCNASNCTYRKGNTEV